MIALLFGRGIGFKCRSGKVMVCFFKKNETKPSAKKVILFPEIGQVENFLKINRPKKRRQKAKETKEENRFDDIARARAPVCVYILPPWRLFPSARYPRHTWGAQINENSSEHELERKRYDILATCEKMTYTDIRCKSAAS